MDNGWSWEQRSLISELIQGMELTKQLRIQLGTTSSADSRELLAQQILSSFEKALLILKWSGPNGEPQTVAAATSGMPESPISINGSSPSDDFDGALKDKHQDNKNGSKKRKMMPRWTNQVRVTTETGLEGSHDDGYSWRKYGQKDILAAKYPRSYYRCTYRNTQNCWATKQVQRSDDDPTIFEVTYRGAHTCSHCSQSVPKPALPENQEKKLNSHNNNHQQNQSQEILFNFRKSLRAHTEDFDNKETKPPFSFPSTSFGCGKSENHSFSPSTLDNNILSSSFSPSFISPATPESNYYSVVPCQMNNFGSVHNMPCSESDFPKLISANTSASNSPIFDMDFSLDPVEIDTNFPFDTLGFFS